MGIMILGSSHERQLKSSIPYKHAGGKHGLADNTPFLIKSGVLFFRVYRWQDANMVFVSQDLQMR